MRNISLELLENYPKCSQDLNPIENAWREVRARLDDTMPVQMETRQDFIKRLRLAVSWVNRHQANYLQQICLEQKVRANAVLLQSGGRTKF